MMIDVCGYKARERKAERGIERRQREQQWQKESEGETVIEGDRDRGIFTLSSEIVLLR